MTPEIRLTAQWVAAAVAGTIVEGDSRRVFAGVSIDTRTLGAGALYVGIRGDRFDGADFADAAVAGGAAGVVLPRDRARTAIAGRGGTDPVSTPVTIAVDDTTVALQALAHRVRVESGAKVVAITGSAGKTTTKEVTAEFLGAKYRVIRNRGNFNNHIGLPLSLMELTARPDVAVVELGMNHAGEISTLVRIAEPDVRVWTNVGDAHVGFFGSEDAIADAKAEILEGATSATVLVANADDERIASRSSSFAGRVVTFGIDRPADVRAEAVVDRGIAGWRPGKHAQGHHRSATLFMDGNLANVLAASGGGGVRGSHSLQSPNGRRGSSRRRTAWIVRLAQGVVLIDDSYNASPTATQRALDVLRATGRAGRRIAVLGEMLELGDRSIALHEEVGRAAAAAGVDFLIAVGGEAAGALVRGAIANGLSPTCTRHIATSVEAAEVAASLIQPADLVLVKGSRGTRTDKVVDRPKAEFA